MQSTTTTLTSYFGIQHSDYHACILLLSMTSISFEGGQAAAALWQSLKKYQLEHIANWTTVRTRQADAMTPHPLTY